MLARYEPVIGLEVHVQLLTKTKLFCSCRNRFGDEPNTNVCPVCLGLPGALPVLSRQAVTLAIRAGLATHCTVHETSIFARKNYFYPDLPKGYQISQYERPLATEGYVEIPSGGGFRRVRLQRIHMEEDAGKLLHEGFPWSAEKSGVDFNRSGIPLIEIVSHPDMRTSEEAYEYLTALKAVLLYAEVSDCNMEEGSLRCDANVSVPPAGHGGARDAGRDQEPQLVPERRPRHRPRDRAAGGGDRVRAGRSCRRRASGTPTAARPRPCAPRRRRTTTATSRSPTCRRSSSRREWIEEVRRSLPELPADKRRRFVAEYGIPDYDAGVLTLTRDIADYYEAVAKESGNPKAASNWVMTEVLRKLKEDDRPLASCPVPPGPPRRARPAHRPGARSAARSPRTCSRRCGRAARRRRRSSSARGSTQVSDEGAIEAAVREVMAASPDQVATYRKGKTGTLGWFVGQVMKKTGRHARTRRS